MNYMYMEPKEGGFPGSADGPVHTETASYRHTRIRELVGEHGCAEFILGYYYWAHEHAGRPLVVSPGSSKRSAWTTPTVLDPP